MAAHASAQLWDTERQRDREGKRGALRGGLAGECVSAYQQGRLRLPTNVLLQFAAFCLTQGNIISAFFISMSWNIGGNTTNSPGKHKRLKIKQITQLY